MSNKEEKDIVGCLNKEEDETTTTFTTKQIYEVSVDVDTEELRDKPAGLPEKI